MRIATESCLVFLFCTAALFFCAAETCQAQGPGMGIGPGGGGHGMRGRHTRGLYSGGWGGRDSYYSVYALYRDGLMPLPPYFSVHPPVYYSYPVPRTYGYSPFAYPGWVRTPDVVAPPQPATIRNPFVDEPPKLQIEEVPIEGATTRTASAPKLILNPYVTKSLTPGAPALARTETP